MFEFKAFRYPIVGISKVDLPVLPGNIECDSDDRPILLHFAPGHLFLPAPNADRVGRLDMLQASGVGMLFDVHGKWRAFVLKGSRADGLLSSTVDLAKVLGRRQCAAVHLFDCPAILARRMDRFDVWVEASYAGAFEEHLGDRGLGLASARWCAQA